MKKIIAVVLSLAMILSMTVCAFAAPVAPVDLEDEAAWTAYYTEVILDAEMEQAVKAAEIVNNCDSAIYANAVNAAVTAAAEQGADTAWVLEAINAKEDELGADLNADGLLGVAGKPVSSTDVEGWTNYYAKLFATVAENPLAIATVVSEIADDISNEAIDMDTLSSVLPAVAEIVGGDVVNQVVWGVESLISMDINGDGVVGKPSDTDLPPADDGEDDGGMDIGATLSDILNTVLGVVGGLINSLFGSDDSTGGDNSGTDDDDDALWGDDGDDLWGDDSSTIPDTGDTTVFAVAAVALAAGAALVMTRKKEEDAE